MSTRMFNPQNLNVPAMATGNDVVGKRRKFFYRIVAGALVYPGEVTSLRLLRRDFCSLIAKNNPWRDELEIERIHYFGDYGGTRQYWRRRGMGWKYWKPDHCPPEINQFWRDKFSREATR